MGFIRRNVAGCVNKFKFAIVMSPSFRLSTDIFTGANSSQCRDEDCPGTDLESGRIILRPRPEHLVRLRNDDSSRDLAHDERHVEWLPSVSWTGFAHDDHGGPYFL